MDENLARWVFISIAKYFEPVVSGMGVPYFVEGAMERTEALMQASHIELRVTGPDVKPLPGSHDIRVSINLLCTSLMDAAGTDAWTIVQWTGVIQSAMLDPIPVYRYGTGADDDETLVGCLRVDQNRVNIYHFGQLEKDSRVRQSEVDASFLMNI